MSTLGSFVWSIADQLRGVYKPNKYGDVILPFTILRRLDCLMEPTRNEVRALAEKYEGGALTARVKRTTGMPFYNTSPFDFAELLKDPEGLAANLIDYTTGFSDNIDVFERFKFAAEVTTLAEKNRLYLVVSKFAEVDLHPDTVPNAEMGDLFEELIRRFAEASNETAGEHYTPRDAIRLMVDLLFAEDSAALLEPGTVRSIYDPTAGTGGMLSVAEERLLARNPDARLRLYGQELNDQSYAICKSDMIAKGQDASNIVLGDTLADDGFYDKTFDFCMSNPPYGYDWKASESAVRAESAANPTGRFGAGMPGVGDGQMLFLTHLAHKMRPAHDGGGRAGIVLNGSPLFNGGAGSGQSEIRRHLLETDLVEAIVALPTNMFFNTGIATYIWILDNDKRPDRAGRVQLIDASSFFTKMRKNLGDKSRELSDTDRDRVVAIYDAFDAQPEADAAHSRVFATTDFGYWTVTVDRPLRLAFQVTSERVEALVVAAGEKGPLKTVDPHVLRDALTALGGERYSGREAFLDVLRPHLAGAGLVLGAPALKAVWSGLGERDEDAEVCLDRHGNPEVDVSARDTETVQFGWAPPGEVADSRYGKDHRDEVVASYVAHEVSPHVPDAWVDHTKTKVGYEVPFTRHFYTYLPPRTLEEIDADLNVLVKEIIGLLQEIET